MVKTKELAETLLNWADELEESNISLVEMVGPHRRPRRLTTRLQRLVLDLHKAAGALTDL